MVGIGWTGLAGMVLVLSCQSAAASPPGQAGAAMARNPVVFIAAPQFDPTPDADGPSPLVPYTPFKQGSDQIEDAPFGPAPGLDGGKAPVSGAADPPKGPEIHYGETDLPPAVARTRRALMEAAKTGDVDELVGVFQQNEMPPSLGFERYDDAATFLKDQSGDPEGREILALLLEILEAGWVHVDEGSAQEMYIWPYFDKWPLDGLSPRQEVELYRILTAGDVAEMRRHGGYIFYRVGIGPDGTLHYFMPSP